MFYIVVCPKYDSTYIIKDDSTGVAMGFDTYDGARADAIDCFDELALDTYDEADSVLIMQVVDNIPAFVASFWCNLESGTIGSNEDPARLR